MTKDNKYRSNDLLEYQFDAEKDIPWNSSLDPGAYFSKSYLQKVGFSSSVINNRETREQLEWAWVITTCRVFSELEKLIIKFVCDGKNQVKRSCRTDLLVKEEGKHILVFNRFAKIVESQHPEWSDTFKNCYCASSFFPETFSVFGEYLKLSKTDGDVDHLQQYFCWLSTLYFEDYTIYFAQMLEDDASSIQPTWLLLNKAHRQEEEQHVRTDHLYLEASPISKEDKYLIAKTFYLYQQNHLTDFLGVGTVIRFLRAINHNPELQVTDRPGYHELGFINDLNHHPLFKTTRHWVPFFNSEKQ